jgi:hypothetical protein
MPFGFCPLSFSIDPHGGNRRPNTKDQQQDEHPSTKGRQRRVASAPAPSSFRPAHVRHLKLKSAKDVLDLVSQYYPANRIAVKTQYLVEGLFDEGKL